MVCAERTLTGKFRGPLIGAGINVIVLESPSDSVLEQEVGGLVGLDVIVLCEQSKDETALTHLKAIMRACRTYGLPVPGIVFVGPQDVNIDTLRLLVRASIDDYLPDSVELAKLLDAVISSAGRCREGESSALRMSISCKS